MAPRLIFHNLTRSNEVPAVYLWLLELKYDFRMFGSHIHGTQPIAITKILADCTNQNQLDGLLRLLVPHRQPVNCSELQGHRDHCIDDARRGFRRERSHPLVEDQEIHVSDGTHQKDHLGQKFVYEAETVTPVQEVRAEHRQAKAHVEESNNHTELHLH